MQNHVVFLGNEKPLHRLLIPQAKENEILNVKNEVRIMENTMESQKVEREELSRLRTAWQLKAAASKPVKQQWAAFKEQLRKVREPAVGFTEI